jgi:hypothetical protein
MQFCELWKVDISLTTRQYIPEDSELQEDLLWVIYLYLLVVRTPAKTQHWPYFTGFLSL